MGRVSGWVRLPGIFWREIKMDIIFSKRLLNNIVRCLLLRKWMGFLIPAICKGIALVTIRWIAYKQVSIFYDKSIEFPSQLIL